MIIAGRIPQFRRLLLQLPQLVLQLGATTEHAFPFYPGCDQLFPLQLDDVTGLGDPSLGFPDSAFELSTGHLRVRKFLTTRLEFYAQFGQAALSIANLGLKGIDGELKIHHFRLDHGLQLSTAGHRAGHQAKHRERNRSRNRRVEEAVPPAPFTWEGMMKILPHGYQRLYGVPFVPTNSDPENTSKIPPSVTSVISCHVVSEFVKGSFGMARRYPALTNACSDGGYFP